MSARPSESARPALPPPEPPGAPRESAPRWWRYVGAKRIVCPCGHHVPNTFHVTESGFIRCSKWAHGVECGRWIFLFAIRGGGTVVAEVTLAEMRQMDAANLQTPGAIVDFLGIWEGGAAAA